MSLRKMVSVIAATAVGCSLALILPATPTSADPLLPSPSLGLPDLDPVLPDPTLPLPEPSLPLPGLPDGDGSDGGVAPDDPVAPEEPAEPGEDSAVPPDDLPSDGGKPRPPDPDDPGGDLYPHPPFAPVDGNPSAAVLQAVYDAQVTQRRLHNQIDAAEAELAGVEDAVAEAKSGLSAAREDVDRAAREMRDDVRQAYKSGAPYPVYTAMTPRYGVVSDGARSRLWRLTAASERVDLLSDQLAAAVDTRDALRARIDQLRSRLKRADALVTRYLGVAASDITKGVPNPGIAAGHLLRWPVRGRVTSEYGNRYDPYYKTWQLHAGIDLAAATGTLVRAAAPGKVVQAGRFGGYGNYVCVAHGQFRDQRMTTCYGHLSRITVRTGQQVDVGDGIGQVGSTGASTGPHLHFEVRLGGRPTNPRLWLPR